MSKSGNSVVLATQNQDKRRELERLMRGTGIRVRPLSSFGPLPKVREDGLTFEANAEKKASVYSRKTQSLVLADDSGLEVRALSGKPGVFSARFAGKKCSYADNNRKLLRLLRSTAWPKRQAKFVSAIALYENGRKIATVRGECEGRIGYAERGLNGFGYDPVFIPKGFHKTYAELSPTQKNRISHRGRALRRAKKILLRFFKRRPASAR